MDSNFLSMSKKDCLTAVKIIDVNIRTKINSASVLAESGDYGSAQSLLITAMEEEMKSFVLFLDHHGFNIRAIKGVKRIFSSHDIRHYVAYLIVLLSIVTRDVDKAINWLNKHDKDVMLSLTLLSILLPKTITVHLIRNLFRGGARYLNTQIPTFIRELKFFESCETYRQNGFFVDYNGLYDDPNTIQESQYYAFRDKTLQVTKGFEAIKVFMSSDGDHSREFIENAIKQSNTKEFKELVTKVINQVMSDRVRAYERTIEVIKEIEDWFNHADQQIGEAVKSIKTD